MTINIFLNAKEHANNKSYKRKVQGLLHKSLNDALLNQGVAESGSCKMIVVLFEADSIATGKRICLGG